MTSLIEKQIVNKEIRVTDPLFEVIHQIQAENEEPLAALNTGYHEPADIRKRLENIISDKVDDTVTVLLPFYTDFGKHISIGKNVFINRQVMFVDLGGICLEDSVLIGPRVNLYHGEPSNRSKRTKRLVSKANPHQEKMLDRSRSNYSARRNDWRECHCCSECNCYERCPRQYHRCRNPCQNRQTCRTDYLNSKMK